MYLPKIRHRLYILCLALCCSASTVIGSAQTIPSVETAQNLFDFHSGFWINLHHFLYWQALCREPQTGTRTLALNKADIEELQRLSPEERIAWDTAVSYYANSLIKHDLLFDESMEGIKNQLEDTENSSDLANVKIPSDLKDVLLKAAPIYKKHWWAGHDAQNQRWIMQLKVLVKEHSSRISNALVKIDEEPWPQHPVRVDTVAYANWSGAYTTLEPTRPSISTTNPANQGAAALEIVFHETSHGMMDKVRGTIDDAEKTINAQNGNGSIHFRRDLWHEVLFYTSGELVAESVPGYIPYADKNGLWTRAWPGPDHALIEQDWKPHMHGTVSLPAALTKLVVDLVEASSSSK